MATSDRYKAAQAALTRFEGVGSAEDPDEELMESAGEMAAALRALITPEKES